MSQQVRLYFVLIPGELDNVVSPLPSSKNVILEHYNQHHTHKIWLITPSPIFSSSFLSLFLFFTISSWPVEHQLDSLEMKNVVFLTENLYTTLNTKVKRCFRFVFSSVESRLGCFCRQLALTLLILRLDCSEREKQKFNSYFQISVKTLLNIGRAAVLESDTKVERCENFEGKFLTENFWYCSLPPDILFGFYFELPISSASKDIWNRRGTRPQYQELLGSRLLIPIHICVKYKYYSRTPCLTGHHPDAKEEGNVPPVLDASSVLLTPGSSKKWRKSPSFKMCTFETFVFKSGFEVADVKTRFSALRDRILPFLSDFALARCIQNSSWNTPSWWPVSIDSNFGFTVEGVQNFGHYHWPIRRIFVFCV